VCPDSGDQGKEKSGKEGSQRKKGAEGVFLTKRELVSISWMFYGMSMFGVLRT
jgi:hypothetical protein